MNKPKRIYTASQKVILTRILSPEYQATLGNTRGIGLPLTREQEDKLRKKYNQ